MNKLTVLYTLMKNMKDKENFKGNFEAEALLDDVQLASATVSGECAPGHCEKNTEIKFGNETIRFSHDGTSQKCCGHSGHGHFHKHMHGEGCCGPKGKFTKAMLLLKLLDKLQLKEEGNVKVLTLSLDSSDIPSEIREHMKSKCCKVHEEKDCCSHPALHSWLAENGCCDIDHSTCELEAFNLQLTLDENCAPVSMMANAHCRCKDTAGKSRNFKLSAKGQFSHK